MASGSGPESCLRSRRRCDSRQGQKGQRSLRPERVWRDRRARVAAVCRAAVAKTERGIMITDRDRRLAEMGARACDCAVADETVMGSVD